MTLILMISSENEKYKIHSANFEGGNNMSNALAIENNLNLENDDLKNVTYESQKSFLESNLGEVINGGINLVLKAILPDIIEDEIIEIKDSIITDGFSAGIKTAIDNVVDMGKSVLRNIYRKI